MSETRDPAIKLFGMTIPVPAHGAGEGNGTEDEELSPDGNNKSKEEEEEEKDLSNETTEDEEKHEAIQISEDPAEPGTSSGINESPKPPSIDQETSTATEATEVEKEQTETSISKEKTLKKPDKILPCPRCNSLDTKFCYYNNYNVNQPRHFCKNCQRYWTAGGTMRNVPVGAGRRKNKNSTSHYRHLTVPEAFQTVRTDSSESIHSPQLKPNGSVLSFGLDAPLCESMASALNLAEKTMQNCHRNGFHTTDHEEARFPGSCGRGNSEEHSHSSASAVTASKNSMEEGKSLNLQEPATLDRQVFPPGVQYFAGAPWNYPWHSAQWRPPLPPPPLQMLPPPPAFCASSFPISFYPATPYWGCTMPGSWTAPWPAPLVSSPNTGSSGSGSSSPKLGKHSREGNTCDAGNGDTSKQSNSERCLWIPKTLRIDDPDEAAKSSIWATLGIKNNKADAIKGGGLFKAFQPKTDDKNHMMDTSKVWHANPAALSRSLNFQESS
ncbi:hypothetical protein MRB53_000017 [Persea americana]|uniref:Uncharacterized protein n=1 Tax=Persea americana TaxID=3435 RepID=A0ACC2MNR8_PERAE|nr:hypothetical protein MRB53_000017 [Persea americana]|eukprot:TRINITY_DN3418_c0_g5_i1.p1 TRINITY_DN3418_c0_g5~~TRINITY_DN3418_c0_g5_i1.p1  ORF type:complete len:496 (-),score=105.01 TRINITY_DN3418_c0_g5_i1:1161-2648(-)